MIIPSNETVKYVKEFSLLLEGPGWTWYAKNASSGPYKTKQEAVKDYQRYRNYLCSVQRRIV